MILYDLHVCVKGMPHPDNCRSYHWLKDNEVNDMVSLSREAFAKEHKPLTGGKHSDGDISYEWKARDAEKGSPMEKWAKGSFENEIPGTHSMYLCASCGLEGPSRSKALGRCEKCSTPIPAHKGFKAAATADTADSAPGKVEQAGHEGCDPSKPSERAMSGEADPMEAEHVMGKHNGPMPGCAKCEEAVEESSKMHSGKAPEGLSKFDSEK